MKSQIRVGHERSKQADRETRGRRELGEEQEAREERTGKERNKS